MTVKFISLSRLPTEFGEFVIHAFEDSKEHKEHIALVFGELAADDKTLTRVHSECLTGDALFSLRCDCGSQLREAMHRIATRGSGIILYLRQEGRNIGLSNKIRAYHLQDEGADTVEANQALGFDADERLYTICQPMLKHLGVSDIELMTNNPLKVDALQNLGFSVSRIPIITGENSHNEAYLATKRNKLGHIPN
ncbi:MAG: GTP cyclohydrolase II [Gammaproteobacteria bacterium]|nr:GTP cyclohydrolase II [Gammaproteobacteria bacterium]